jgi:hypothetical protein
MAVQWADVSYYQPVVNDNYPHPVLCVRSNDGTYRDPAFAKNFAWAKRAMANGRLSFIIVYCVWRPNWEQTAATTIDMVGTPPHPRVVVMIDVESWGGQIQGNQSDGINRMYWKLAEWLGDRRRVIGYGNQGDLRSLWPQRPDGVKLVVAAYGGAPPKFPGMIAHQYSSSEPCTPFGSCDMNSANDYDDAEELARAFGLAPLSGHPMTLSARKHKGHHEMNQLPATAMPAAPNSDPSRWEQRNFTIGFDVAGGWEGGFAYTFGIQDFSGRTVDDVRGYLRLASWITAAGLTPVSKELSTEGAGIALSNHKPTIGLSAPVGASGVTFNYAAPGGAYVTEARSA